MVITVLEARVASDRIGDLERVYGETAAELPPDILETFLVRDAGDPAVLRIVTVWTGHAALAAMRASGATPKGIQIFRAVGAEPELSILDVVAHRAQPRRGMTR